MKKAFIPFVALAFVTMSSSCIKSFTCECVHDDNGTISTSTETVQGFRKAEAKTICEAGTNSTSSGGYTYSSTCTIKK